MSYILKIIHKSFSLCFLKILNENLYIYMCMLIFYWTWS